jgi:opacity protein-like surface antigen
MLKKFLIMIVLTVPCLCMAQDSSKMDVSINVNGLFPSHSETNGLGQSAPASGGLLASFRYSPSRLATFEFNYGHARDTQYFTNGGMESSVHTGVHEVSGAYVFNLPWRSSRLQPFALVGAGIMQFNPFSSGTSVSGTQSQTKPAVLWGAGVNYDISRHLALRLQYRGLLYAGPDFKVTSLKTDRWQPVSQPSFGIVYRF